ncbi:E3 ubiquitin-protein ligase FANCL isoform X3 [Vidua macroura]|uniref:E3 ubiquitin-protein ligase FANCL isoform X3 n=1 Tax=Vidua macroura TaxID=187451 RepID=UPI0023A87313|nr:E3 ubiquitin-protein ligase FANCL isoform X3 [Vidua macroura]
MAGTGARALFRHCPLLLPQDRHGTAYEGFVTAQKLPHQDTATSGFAIEKCQDRVQLVSEEDPAWVSAHFKAAKRSFGVRIQQPWSPKEYVVSKEEPLPQRLHSCPDLVSFMVELKTVLEIALKNTQDLHIPRPPEYYTCLVRDLEILGWNRVAYVDTGLTTVKLKAEDSCGRQHLISLKLNSKYPTEPPDCLVDFPVPFAVSWMPQNSLIDIYNQFLAALESLKEFWDALDEIDGKTWVLEPENPTRSAITRRIAIGNNVSVNVEVDPRHPNMLPECYFLGADHEVNPLRTKLNNNMHLWTLPRTVGSAMPIGWMAAHPTKCVMILAVGSPSTRPVSMSGYKAFLPADRVLMSSLVNVPIVISP